MRRFLMTFCVLPGLAFAAGSEDSEPPKSTNTTTTCETGMVWDANSAACVAPKDSRLDDTILYGAVRELAYAGKIDAAQQVLAAMSDQTEPRVLTYWGFTHGQQGQYAKALGFYQAALDKDPANILTRSYMGQALLASGDRAGAKVQLARIAALGGNGTWAANALKTALQTGKTYSY